MARLKSRHEFPPNGWKFYQPQTRWELPGNLSFNGAVLEIIQHRTTHAGFLHQYKLSRDYNTVADELDEFNAVRCLNAGHLHFLSDCTQSNDYAPTGERTWVSDDVAIGSKRKDVGNLITVALPFCRKDAGLMFKQISWMGELGGARDHHAVIAFDHDTPQPDVARIGDIAKVVFRSVSILNYPNPRTNYVIVASKECFNHVARFIETEIRTPWIWWEADMTALKPGFMSILQRAYERAGKAFFGPIVPQMGHMNGTSVYPPNTYSLCPSLRQDNSDAFDTGMRGEMDGNMADASPLIYHVWVVRDGGFHPHGEGMIPVNVTPQLLNQIPPNAVAFHRCKDDSIIRLLRAKHQ